jgi:hypothetical protein
MATHYYLKPSKLVNKFITVRASFRLRTGIVAGFIHVIVEQRDIIF